jgi:SpoVK/Ycf46/Vps4 family AAA+-type ATPase
MKINSINNISFKGIKVKGRKKNPNIQQSAGTYTVRKPQQRIMDDWKRDIELSFLERNNQSLFEVSDLSDVWDEETKHVNTSNFIDRSAVIADKLVLISKQALENLKKCDRKEEFPDLKTGETIYSSRPEKGVSRIAGYEREIRILNEEFIDKVKREKDGEDVDIAGGVLFFGPIGNGKTSITKAIAEETDAKIVKIRSSKPTDHNEQQKIMDKILEIAQKNEENFEESRARTIIFIDEADRFLNDNSVIRNSLKEFIKTCSKNYHCSVFMATNSPLRMGIDFKKDEDVFPIIMSIEPPEGENLRKVLEFFIKNYKSKGTNVSELANEAERRNKDTKSKFNIGQLKDMITSLYRKDPTLPLTQEDICCEIHEAQPEITEDLYNKFLSEKNAIIGEDEC